MRPFAPFLFILASSVIATARAGPAENAIVALMRLSDQPNYSWVATVDDDARRYDIHGRTVRGEFTWVKMPVVNSLRRQLGRSVTDTEIELIFRGNVDYVVHTENGWRSPSELPPALSEPGSPDGSGAGSARRRIRGAVVHRPTTASNPNANPRAYSNLQLGVSHPHEELAIIVGSHETFAVAGDVCEGKLTTLGAQLLLVRDGQEKIEPLAATGTFKVWIRNGGVDRYQVSVEGILNVQLSSGTRQLNVRQVTHTTLKDIGTTRLDIPPDVRARLLRE